MILVVAIFIILFTLMYRLEGIDDTKTILTDNWKELIGAFLILIFLTEVLV